MTETFLKIGFMNIRGQTGLTNAKEIEIEAFIVRERLDILHLQEINIIEDSFSTSNNISSQFNIISNNAANRYGTATMVRSDIATSNILFDTKGRAIVFDIGNITLANLYLPSGSDSPSKSEREDYFSTILPHLLLNRQDSGCVGGDFNCIMDRRDCTNNAAIKMSPCLAKLVQTFSMKDSYRHLHPTTSCFSHFYHTIHQGEGATRLDRSYNWGGITAREAKYEPVSFSDHLAYVVSFSLPVPVARILSPRSRSLFKIKPEVIKDQVFQERLAVSINDWQEVHDLGLDIITWWEVLVKPGIRKLALQRSKELNRARRGELNLLLLRQAYLTRLLQLGQLNKLGELKAVQQDIMLWYDRESKKIILQSKVDDLSQSEQIRIYHHDLHRKSMKRSSILRLQTEQGLLEGHDLCSSYLEEQVANLLLSPAPLHLGAREALLEEVQQVFTDQDNQNFMKLPDQKEVKEVLNKSNLLAAPGSDGIPSLLYHECWNTLKLLFTKVIQAIFSGSKPPLSMRTSMMVFGNKPKKMNSIKPGDKRRISLLNSDFKVVTGIEAKRFGNTATYSLSPLQFVAGDNRRIHHGINQARDAIQQVSKTKVGCGILDLDFLAGFDWLDMAWVYLVLEKKGVVKEVIDRLENLYSDSISVVMVNNIQGRAIPNIRGSLRQGDIPSMYWFGVGNDPLLFYLERRLQGIQITSLPTQGPSMEQETSNTREHLKEVFKLVAYADDVKPAISCMNEFNLVDNACNMLEKASGVKLHRDPSTDKVKFLPLGRWRGVLAQEDIPYQYIRLSEHLDFVGVELKATFTQTRKANGDLLQTRIKNRVGSWKAGRFMPLTQRAFSANCYALSKVWFKCNVINLRVQDHGAITSQIKSWMYQDLLIKPSELVLFRSTSVGGLGLINVRIRALAILIRTFLETSVNPKFRHSLFHEHLYRYHIMGELDLPNPGFTPYYDQEFFKLIAYYKNQGTLDVATMTIKQWYTVLVEDKLLMSPATEDSPAVLLPIRPEIRSPQTDWSRVWQNARKRGLGTELSSFQFKVIHDLLPTQERISRIGAAGEPQDLCLHCRLDREDLVHCFFDCPRNKGVGLRLLGCIQQVIPGLSSDAALRLDFVLNLADEEQLAVQGILINGLKYIWEAKLSKKTLTMYRMRAEIEAYISLLRRTRFSNAAVRMEEMVEIWN